MAGARSLFDLMDLQEALQKLLEIIGEASNAISDEFRADQTDVPWRHVVNLRHLLARHDHRVGMDQIWTIATLSVPALAEQPADNSAGPITDGSA